MSDWKECKLWDITSKIGSGATPTGGENSYKSSGIKLIRSQNVYDFHFDILGLAFIDEDQANLLNNVSVEENDILMNITGESVTRCCLAPKEYLPARVNQHVSIIRPIRKDTDYKFVFYYLHSIKPELNSIAEIGCTRRALTKSMIENLSICLPPLPEQKAIASVLSSLDDKIDLLHRQNKTLEAMEEILFRQWFVDSDELNVNNEKFGNVVQFIKGKKPKNTFEVFIDGLVPQILIETFDTGKTLFSEPENMVIANQKDILMVMDGASSGRVEIGFIGIVGSTIGLFKPVDNFNFPLFLFHFLKSNEDVIKDNTTGSAIPHTDKALVLNLDFKYLNINKVKEFEQIAYTWFQKKLTNRKQIYTLEKLRGTMLPKLMSGEVKVKYEKN